MDSSPDTIAQYLSTLRVWERVTHNPTIDKLDPITLAGFRVDCPGSPATVAKHCRHLNHLFAKLGPPGPRNRDALGLLTVAPWIKPPRHEQQQPRIPADDDVARFVARAPDDLALFAVLAATTGSRNTAIRRLTPDAIDRAGQFLRFPAHTDKRRQERLKPIPALTLRWLTQHERQLARLKINASSFGARWRRWALKVGTPTLRPHGLKRWWGAQLIRAQAPPWCTRYALGHAQRDVTGLAYINP
ncbi:MAG TPA: tyrosine-type recombinase/integrase, partial [Lacipirellulaceae bacterium]|nr:tyrosine-type recombinase/integrase [Lacipirellulaceae bacterium]